MYFRPLTQVHTLFSVVKCKGDVAATHWSCISRLVCIEPPVCYLSPSELDVILRIHHCCSCSFLFGWPPCQRPDMTLVEVSQHAYNYLFIRTMVLFVFLRNSCEPDMVYLYIFLLNKFCLSLSESEISFSYSEVHAFGFSARPFPCSHVNDVFFWANKRILCTTRHNKIAWKFYFRNESMTPYTMTAIALHSFGMPSYRLQHRILDKNPSPNGTLCGMETIWATAICEKEGRCTWHYLWWYLYDVFVSWYTKNRQILTNYSGVEWVSEWVNDWMRHDHDDVIKWKHFSRYWSFVRGIHRSPVDYLHKGQLRGALLFSLICAWRNGSANTRDAGDLRRIALIMTSL